MIAIFNIYYRIEVVGVARIVFTLLTMANGMTLDVFTGDITSADLLVSMWQQPNFKTFLGYNININKLVINSLMNKIFYYRRRYRYTPT